MRHLYNNIYTTDSETEAEAFACFWGGSYERVTGFPNDYFKVTI
jgi:hypothetical protein